MPGTEMPDDQELRQAVANRDAAADGRFVYAVLSTGIYCHPSCSARAARPDNLRFYPTRDAAERAGYRPCRRCRPDLPPRAQREADLVASACREIEAGCFDAVRFAADHGTSPAQLARIFRRVAGITPRAYAASRRQRVVQAGLRAGGSVTDTLYEAGFGSSGRFYEATDGMLGMTPGAWRDGGAGERLDYAAGESWLGRVLVAATGRGVCAILIGADDPSLLADLARRFPKAELRPAGDAFAVHLAAVLRLVDEPASSCALPLDIRGTVFQRRVWQALREIPAGSRQTYSEVARRLDMPGSTRAVAAACSANRLAVAVPCHRVVAASGALAGYRWGVERKRALLDREA